MTQESKSGHGPIERRGLLSIAICSLLSVIGTALGIPAAFYLFAPGKRHKSSNWVEVGDISKLKADSPREFTFRRVEFDGWRVRSNKQTTWVLKKQDGSVTAFSPWCTHLGCAYHWEGSRRQFACPCHGSWFSESGEVLSGPAPRALDRYVVKLEGTRLWLDLVQIEGSGRS